MNIKRAIALTGLVAATAGVSPLAFAQDSGWYVGASVGQSSFKDGCTGVSGTGFTCEDTDTAFGVFGGYQVNKYFGAELGYTDLGKITASGSGINASIKAKGFEFVGVGTFPINPQFEVYGKLGFFRWDVDASGSGFGVGVSQSETGTDLTYGLGVKYNFTKSFGVRAQYQRYKDVGNEDTTGKGDVDVISVGVVYKF
jgi:OOP family OmpA-OmpF porin